MEQEQTNHKLIILGASFWANWDHAKALHKMKSPLAKQQFDEANKIRKEWQEEQRKQSQ